MPEFRFPAKFAHENLIVCVINNFEYDFFRVGTCNLKATFENNFGNNACSVSWTEVISSIVLIAQN